MLKKFDPLAFLTSKNLPPPPRKGHALTLYLPPFKTTGLPLGCKNYRSFNPAKTWLNPCGMVAREYLQKQDAGSI